MVTIMKRRILVVEDSPTQAELLRLLLEGAGYQVDLAPNGREGLKKVRGAPPDLIISDVMMPEMDGYAFCQAVKSAERTRRIPFVLLTQRNTPQDILWGLTRGADNFITKPFDDEYLLERVKRIFEHLDLRGKGQLEVDVTLRVGEREIVINADKQQIVELLFATFEDVCRLNNELLDARRALEDHATNLEAKVRERTEALCRLNRDLRVVSLCNEILVRATSEEELLRGICQTIVGVGEDRAAWAGFVAEGEERHVRPVAVVGCEPELVDSHAMDLADPALETCPVTLAIRTGAVQVVQNIPGNPPCCPWREEAVRLGIGSSISLPLKDGERSFGVLTIYSALLDAFDAEEVTLLGELANDLAYGIQAIRTRTAHERALAEIESLARFPNENPSPVMRVREDGIILYANAPSEPLLRLWDTAVGDGMPADWSTRIRRVMESGAQERIDLSCDDRVYAIIVTPIAGGAYVNLYGRDITDRKRAEEALQTRTQQLEAVRHVTEEITRELELSQVLSLIIHRSIELVGADSGIVRLWDESQELLIPHSHVGMPPDRLFRLRLGEGVAGIVAQRRAGMIVNDFQTSSVVSPHIRQGSAVCATLAQPLLYRDRLVGVISIFRETPARPFNEEDRDLLGLFAAHAAIAIENARLYQQIQQHAATLEQRVQERTQELAAANQQLQDASRHKSEFLANMSHEIRTPLNSIIGFAELLREQGMGPLTERQARYLTHIANGGKHLVQLIGDILDLSKVEAGKFILQPEPLPVKETLEDILVIARGLANKKAQEIQVEIAPDLPSLHADPVRFKQILFNLLSNAVKFTPAKGRITLRAFQKAESRRQKAEGSGQLAASGDQRPEGGRQKAEGRETIEPALLPTAECPLPTLVIEVKDTGIGIKPEDLPRLFQEFVQLERTQKERQEEGTGLGLALTKRLVELHGGRIWAESEGERQGSTFTVVLPFEGPEGSGQ
jgi:signal transduction histidine kinase/DNA-binding response OmpR family regulator